jgi:hypothetical protein
VQTSQASFTHQRILTMRTTMTEKMCFYVPGQLSIIDTVKDNGKSFYDNESLEEIDKRYPGAILISFEDAIAEIEALAQKKYITEVDEERFMDMLEILPPMNWKQTTEGEVFMMCEMNYSHYTNIFCQIKDRYFEFSDSRFLTLDQIINKVKSSEVFTK